MCKRISGNRSLSLERRIGCGSAREALWVKVFHGVARKAFHGPTHGRSWQDLLQLKCKALPYPTSVCPAVKKLQPCVCQAQTFRAFVSVHDVHIWAAWSAPSCALAGAVPRPTRSAPRAPGGCRGERTRNGTGEHMSLGETDRARALGRAWLCSLWLGKDQALLPTTQLTCHSSRASARSSPKESISQTLRGSASLTQSDLFPG